MRRTFLIAAVPAVLGAILAGVFSAGERNFYVFYGAMLLGIYTLPFAGIGILAILWLRRRQGPRTMWREHVGGVLLAWCLFLVLLAPAWLVGNRILGFRIERAKERAKATIDALQAYRADHGRYPEEIAVPDLVEYRAHEGGLHYDLVIDDPGSFGGRWVHYPGRGWAYTD